MLGQSKDVCFRRSAELASFLGRGRLHAHKRSLMAWNTRSAFSGHAEVTSLNLPKDAFPLGSHYSFILVLTIPLVLFLMPYSFSGLSV